MEIFGKKIRFIPENEVDIDASIHRRKVFSAKITDFIRDELAMLLETDVDILALHEALLKASEALLKASIDIYLTKNKSGEDIKKR